jgi:hypothetical protein
MASPVVGLKGFPSGADSGTETARHAATTDVFRLDVTAHPLLHRRGEVTVGTAKESVRHTQPEFGIDKAIQLCNNRWL